MQQSNRRSLIIQKESAEFPLEMWKIYLNTIADTDDMAVTWRIFTQMTAHAALLQQKHRPDISACLDCIDNSKNSSATSRSQPENITKQMVCARLENISWRVWFEQSKIHMKKHRPIQRHIMQSSAINLPSAYRDKETKINEWIDSYVISRSSPTNTDSCETCDGSDFDMADLEGDSDFEDDEEEEVDDEEDYEDDYDEDEEGYAEDDLSISLRASPAASVSKPSLLTALIRTSAGCLTHPNTQQTPPQLLSFVTPSHCPVAISSHNAVAANNSFRHQRCDAINEAGRVFRAFADIIISRSPSPAPPSTLRPLEATSRPSRSSSPPQDAFDHKIAIW